MTGRDETDFSMPVKSVHGEGKKQFTTWTVEFIPSEYWDKECRNGRMGYFMKDREGVMYSSFNEAHGKVMKAHAAFEMPLRVIYTQRGDFFNVWSLMSAGGDVV